MKKWKRAVVGLLIATMTVPMVACGGSKKTGSTNVMDKAHVYREESVQFDVNTENLNRAFTIGNRVYFVSTVYANGINSGITYGVGMGETLDVAMNDTEAVNDTAIAADPVPADEVTTDSADEVTTDTTDVIDDLIDDKYPDDSYNVVSTVTYTVTSFLTDGSDKKEFSIVEENTSLSNYTADKDGNFYYVESRYEDGTDADGNYFYNESYILVKTDSTGKELWRTDLTALKTDPDSYFYPNSILVLESGEIGVLLYEGLMLISADGAYVSTIKELAECDSASLRKDGNLLVSKYGDSGQEYYTFDVNAKKMSDKLQMSASTYNYNTYPGNYYDLYLSDSTAVYGYNIGDAEPTELMNFIDSDISIGWVNGITAISEDTFLLMYNDSVNYKLCAVVMKKVPESEVVEKEIITLACYYLNYNVKSYVVEFNKTNPKYRISIEDYSKYDVYENDQYTSGTAQLNSDLVAGKVPDIVITNQQLPIASYISKGMFADLNDLFENDADIKRSDYLENIFDAYTQNGKLYQIVPSFNAITVIGKTSEVGSERGWTMNDMMSLLASKPEGTQTFSEITRSDALNYCMTLGSSQFIDQETGKVNFTGEGFIQLLNFAKSLPEEINWDELYNDDSYWTEYGNQYRSGKTLLQYYYLSSFSDYNRQKQGSYGEDITFIGFPTENKVGSAISSDFGMSVSAKSSVKEGAWEFIRYFLMDDYQSTIEYGWPVKLSAYENLKQKAKEKPYYTDYEGNKIEYDDSYWLGDTEITITPCTDADIEYVMDFLKSLTQVYYVDDDLMSIIQEEAAAFFSGQKTAEDVAAIIQSRAQIYVSEGR